MMLQNQTHGVTTWKNRKRRWTGVSLESWSGMEKILTGGKTN
jgi:hypothetical protein